MRLKKNLIDFKFSGRRTVFFQYSVWHYVVYGPDSGSESYSLIDNTQIKNSSNKDVATAFS